MPRRRAPVMRPRNRTYTFRALWFCRFCTAHALVLCLLGCESVPGETVFGAAEPTYKNWELERRDSELISGELAESIRGPIETRVERILKVLPAGTRARIGQVHIDVLNAPNTLFIFESGFGLVAGTRRSIIQTSSETIAGLEKIAMAQQVGMLIDDEGAWLNRYLLYVRTVPDGQPILDPLRASGVIRLDGTITSSIDAAHIKEIAHNAKLTFDIMLTFLVAHEIAHLTAPRADQGSNETKAAYNERVRRDEAKADREGLRMLAAIEASQPQQAEKKTLPLYILGAPFLFHQWIISMQGSRHSLTPTTHPLDHVRALSAVSFIESLLPTLPVSDNERAKMTKAIQESKLEIQGIDQQGAQYFADLDEEAKTVTIESLRFFK
jgi:hypothetical protein